MKSFYKFLPFIAIFNVMMTGCTSTIKKKINSEIEIDYEHNAELNNYIRILNSDFSLHEKVGSKLTPYEIEKTENSLGVYLPDSYKYFLKEFGDGAYSLYNIDQPINRLSTLHRLGEYRTYLSQMIESDGFGTFDRDYLVCLMTENSNGGAWVWLTNEKDDAGECPLAYYHISDKKLYYKLSGFKKWLRIATSCKCEVIRDLDSEYRLGLG